MYVLPGLEAIIKLTLKCQATRSQRTCLTFYSKRVCALCGGAATHFPHNKVLSSSLETDFFLRAQEIQTPTHESFTTEEGKFPFRPDESSRQKPLKIDATFPLSKNSCGKCM